MGQMGGHGMGHQQGGMIHPTNQMLRGQMGNPMGPGQMGAGQMGHPGQMMNQHHMAQMGHPQQMNSMMGGMGQMGQNMPHSTMQPSQMMSQNHGMGINPMMNSSQMLNPMTNQMTGNSQGLNNNIAQQGSMNQMQGAVPQMQPQQDAERNRFIAELEFVQCLANPNYICFLAQHGYFKKPEFINYLSYLEYWKDPKYARLIRYPTCLRFLELLQEKKFREAISVGRNAKEIDDQILLAWNRRHRIRNERMSQAQIKNEQKVQK